MSEFMFMIVFMLLHEFCMPISMDNYQEMDPDSHSETEMDTENIIGHYTKKSVESVQILKLKNKLSSVILVKYILVK
jgi:hypothetical protein